MRTVKILVVAAIGLAAGAPAAHAAETIYGTTGTTLVRFSSASPGTIEATRTITNLQAAETIRGIDVRPATGELMALGSTNRLYRIDPRTGVATEIDAGSALTGTRFAIDFNPVVDRLRIVSDAEDNDRYNPVDGTVTSDTPLAPAGNVVSAAYDRNVAGGATTTLFGIDSDSDSLVRIGGVDGTPSANGGVVTTIGALGVDTGPEAGFDVSGGEGIAYATLRTGTTTGLYAIDLATGLATLRGTIGEAAVLDIAVAQPAYQFVALVDSGGGTNFVTGWTDTGTVTTPRTATGPGTELMLGLDQRRSTGELVGIGTVSRVFALDPETGHAVRLGTLAPPAVSPHHGWEIDPLDNYGRLLDDTERNARVSLTDGSLLGEDPSLTPAGNVTALAYTPSSGALAIDSTSDQLLSLEPTSGALTTIGPLQTSGGGGPTVNISPLNGFDIAPGGGFAVAAFRPVGGSSIALYRINPSTGTITGGGRIIQAGSWGLNMEALRIALLSPGTLSTGPVSGTEKGGVVKVPIVRTGGSSGPATVEYATSNGTAVAGQDYTATSGVARFADGATIALVEVPVLDDAAAEDDETFTLTLSKAGEGAVLGTATAMVSIGSDDVAPVVTPPVVTPPDTTKPLAFLTPVFGQSLRSVAARGLKLRVVSGEPATARVSARVDAATRKRLKLKRRTIGSRRTTFTAAGVKTVTIRPAAKIRRALRRSRRPIRFALSATVTDTAGNASKASAVATLPRR